MKDKDLRLRYECVKCGEVEVVSRDDNKFDGTSCKKCGGHISPAGYVLIGIDLANGPDQTYCHSAK